MLCADGLQFRYDVDDVLRGVSLQVPDGRLLGIIGPNGSGKTTLLRLLAGLLAPTAGRITLDGSDLSAHSRRALARRLALVPQETHVTFDYSVLDIVLMGRYPHLGTFGVEGPDDFDTAWCAMEATGTSHLARRSFATLSGGERQRVVIAAALAQLAEAATSAPPLLLLDEPTASLDLGYQLDIAELVRRLHESGTTVIVSTHDLNLAASTCEELVLLRHGRILAGGPTRDVLTEDHVRALYDVEARVSTPHADGRAVVVPIARTR